MFCLGCINGMRCFVQFDKNSMGCFVQDGKSLWDVLSGVSKMAWDVLSWDVLSGCHSNMASTNSHLFCVAFIFFIK